MVPCLTASRRQGFPYMVQRLPLRNEGHFCVNILVMITVYYLKSTLDAATYIGMAKDDIARLKKHDTIENHFFYLSTIFISTLLFIVFSFSSFSGKAIIGALCPKPL
jgi:hypothetical protein